MEEKWGFLESLEELCGRIVGIWNIWGRRQFNVKKRR